MWFQNPYRNARLILFAEVFNKKLGGRRFEECIFKPPINNTDMGICVIDVVEKMGGLKNMAPHKSVLLKVGQNRRAFL